MEFLFVYGTLMKKCQRNEWSTYLHENAEFIGEAWTEGLLYKIAHYPGLIKGDGKVYGELFRLNSPKESLEKLDAYESYYSFDTQNSQYLREVTEVNLIEEKKVKGAWVYYYNLNIEALEVYPAGKFFFNP
jgi:gamma-glutamylcyclotransferase (GGCT)/AIG2-like uncharacterized protein YtfP